MRSYSRWFDAIQRAIVIMFQTDAKTEPTDAHFVNERIIKIWIENSHNQLSAYMPHPSIERLSFDSLSTLFHLADARSHTRMCYVDLYVANQSTFIIYSRHISHITLHIWFTYARVHCMYRRRTQQSIVPTRHYHCHGKLQFGLLLAFFFLFSFIRFVLFDLCIKRLRRPRDFFSTRASGKLSGTVFVITLTHTHAQYAQAHNILAIHSQTRRTTSLWPFISLRRICVCSSLSLIVL